MSMGGDVGAGKSDIKVELNPVFGNEKLSACGGEGDAGRVTSVSAVGSGDTVIELVLASVVPWPAGCVGGEVGNDSPIAAGNVTDETESVDVMDGVGDECPERPRRGDRELMEGHARTRPRNRLSTSCGRNLFSSGRLVLKLRSMCSSDSYVNST